MAATTAVYLITGFLGSGKTTFLNRLVEAFPKDRKLMILMNEFGDVGVDGPLVSVEDADMLEISKGSIFCVCVKTDFIRGLMDISQRIRPDALIIEATGIANPSDLKRDLKLSIFQDRFRFKEQFCMIDAEAFEDVYDTFTSVEKQIESSTVFIVNKVDLVDEETVEKVKAIVAAHHADPQFYETVYADIPLYAYLPEDAESNRSPDSPMPPISPQALDTVVEQLIADPDNETAPTDQLLSAVYVWSGSDRKQFDGIARAIPEGIVRAKGLFHTDGSTWLFNFVMGRGEIVAIDYQPDMADRLNRIVFIGTPQAIDMLASTDFGGRLHKHDSTLIQL